MSEGIRKFAELMKTDEAFQAKLNAALENYAGERTDEAVFEAVLTPLAREYGIRASFEEYKQYTGGRELSEDELVQVSGGANKSWQDTPCITSGYNPSPDACPCGITDKLFCPKFGVF